MDALTLIDGHVLLPDPHNWGEGGPEWKLTWTTHEEAALRGNEGRSAMRVYPRPTLTFAIWPPDQQAAARHQARVRRGLALGGRFCCPHHGRANWLASDAAAGAAQITLLPTPWHWTVGARLLLRTADQQVSVHSVTAVGGSRLTVTPALPLAILADTAVYPLFFGRSQTPPRDEVWSPDLPVSQVALIGEVFAIDPTLVPACCQIGGGGGDGTGSGGGPTAFGLLQATWRNLRSSGQLPAPAASNFGDVPTDPDHVLHRGCLRFIEVTNGSITTTLGGSVPAEVTAATMAAAAGASGTFAVEFYGTRGPFRAGMHPRHLFTPSSNNYNIYLLP